MELRGLVEQFLMDNGALRVGFAARETLDGGPPSVDLGYVLPGAQSAICFALPLTKEYIRPFLAKEDRLAHERDRIALELAPDSRVTTLSKELAELLRKSGHEARGVSANLRFRTEIPGWQRSRHPDLSHRYLAVCSGLGSFGWSGNVGIKGYGTTIVLGTTVTTAAFEPTGPVPQEESFCTNCKLCHAACAVEMFDRRESVSVTIGGETFTHAARRNLMLCDFCCGGFTGLHKSRKWSTWSPGRHEIPEDDNALARIYAKALKEYAKRPLIAGGFEYPTMRGQKLHLTCSNCQLICWGDSKSTAENVKLLHQSGCIIEETDGTLRRLPPEEAEAIFETMDPARKNLYC
jgi:epoxyqueuosine reductase QueG